MERERERGVTNLRGKVPRRNAGPGRRTGRRSISADLATFYVGATFLPCCVVERARATQKTRAICVGVAHQLSLGAARPVVL